MPFRVIERTLDEVLVIEPILFADERGEFMEVFRRDAFQALGIPDRFVQENHSRSRRGVLRGLHFQWDPPMGKLMRVTRGEAFLVAVDIRCDSPTLGRHHAIVASRGTRLMLWAPAGFARGFCALEEDTEVQYLCTGTYNPAGESIIRWNDPAIAIRWPVTEPILSPKDAAAADFRSWMERPESRRFTRGVAPAGSTG